MSRKSTKSQLAVERLLEERRQYDVWLAKLAEPGAAGMPAHVVDRVRADYQSRLDDVTRQLARHERELEVTLAELQQRRDEMAMQRSLREEALAEVRLRHTVGEFDEGQYTELSADHTAFIAQIAEELETTERDIARLEEVLGLVAGSLPGAEAPLPSPESAAGAPSPLPPPPAEPPAAAAAPAPEPTPHPAPPPPEPVAAARPRVSTEVPSPAIPPARPSGSARSAAGPRAVGEPPKAGPQMDALDELAFIRSVAQPGAPAPREEGEEERGSVPPTSAAPPAVDTPAAAAPEPIPTAPAPPSAEPAAPARERPAPPSQPPAPPAAAAVDEGALRHPVQHMTLGEPDEAPGTGMAAGGADSRPIHEASKGTERGPRPPERPSEADASAKTLRCTECGTYNLPTEWYCEKCGAELSAF
jgi:hypothetical protein